MKLFTLRVISFVLISSLLLPSESVAFVPSASSYPVNLTPQNVFQQETLVAYLLSSLRPDRFSESKPITFMTWLFRRFSSETGSIGRNVRQRTVYQVQEKISGNSFRRQERLNAIRRVLPSDVTDPGEMARWIDSRFGNKWEEAISLMGRELLRRERREFIDRAKASAVPLMVMADWLHASLMQGHRFEDLPTEFVSVMLKLSRDQALVSRTTLGLFWKAYQAALSTIDGFPYIFRLLKEIRQTTYHDYPEDLIGTQPVEVVLPENLAGLSISPQHLQVIDDQRMKASPAERVLKIWLKDPILLKKLHPWLPRDISSDTSGFLAVSIHYNLRKHGHEAEIAFLQSWWRSSPSIPSDLMPLQHRLESTAEAILRYHLRNRGVRVLRAPSGGTLFHSTDFKIHRNTVARVNAIYLHAGYRLVYEDNGWLWQKELTPLSPSIHALRRHLNPERAFRGHTSSVWDPDHTAAHGLQKHEVRFAKETPSRRLDLSREAEFRAAGFTGREQAISILEGFTDTGDAVHFHTDTQNPFRRRTETEEAIGKINMALKKKDPEAIRLAARDMIEHIPAQAALIPIPTSAGDLSVNGDLIHALLSLRADLIRVDAIVAPLSARGKMRDQYLQGHFLIDPASLQFKANPERLPDLQGRPIVFIDNAISGGVTFEAARRALGNRGRGLSFVRWDDYIPWPLFARLSASARNDLQRSLRPETRTRLQATGMFSVPKSPLNVDLIIPFFLAAWLGMDGIGWAAQEGSAGGAFSFAWLTWPSEHPFILIFIGAALLPGTLAVFDMFKRHESAAIPHWEFRVTDEVMNNLLLMFKAARIVFIPILGLSTSKSIWTLAIVIAVTTLNNGFYFLGRFKELVNKIGNPQRLTRYTDVNLSKEISDLMAYQAGSWVDVKQAYRPDVHQVKAVGLQWAFDGWKFWTVRQAYVLWYEEPYVWRWVSLLPPWHFYIIPTSAWVPAKDRVQAWGRDVVSRWAGWVPAKVPRQVPVPIPGRQPFVRPLRSAA